MIVIEKVVSIAATEVTVGTAVAAGKERIFSLICINTGEDAGTIKVGITSNETLSAGDYIEYDAQDFAKGNGPVWEKLFAVEGEKVIIEASTATFACRLSGYESLIGA